MKKGTLLRSPLWPGNPQPRARRLKTVGGIALMATLMGCGVLGPEPPAFVVRGIVWAEPGSTPSVVAQPLEGVSVWLSVNTGSVKLGIPNSPRVLARATSDVEGRFELQIQPNGSCYDDPDKPASTVYLTAGKGGYHMRGGGSSNHSFECSGLVGGVAMLLEPESDLNFVSQPSASEEECLARSPGTICYSFGGGYVWLITDPVQTDTWLNGVPTSTSSCGRRSGGFYRREGQAPGTISSWVDVAVCDQFEYHHVLDTDLVAQVPLNP